MRTAGAILAVALLAGCGRYCAEINDAAAAGNLAEVKRLIAERHELVQAPDMNGDRPIHRAARRGRDEVVALLLEKGADVNVRDGLGHTALRAAVEGGRAGTVGLLLAHGADVSIPDIYDRKTPLHVACRQNYVPFVRQLLDAGADPNARDRHLWTPLHESASFEHPEEFFEMQERMPELMRRMEETGLVRHEPEIDEEMRRKMEELRRKTLGYLKREYERTRYLIGESNREAAETLIAAGADVDAADRSGGTPLHLAAERGHAGMAEVLIRSKADANGGARGWTPLIMAAREGHTKVAELLVEAGADVNARGRKGDTALLWAAFFGRGDVVGLLLKNGAEVNTADDEGRTPLGAATRPRDAEETAVLEVLGEGQPGGRERIARLLREHGARD